MRNMSKFFAIFAVFVSAIFAQADFRIIQSPTWVVNPDDEVWIQWLDVDRNIHNPRIYFSRNPNGSIIENYVEFIPTRPLEITGSDQKRGIKFVPQEITNFRPGINYVVIHDPITKKTSNEVKLVLKHVEQNSNMRPNGGLVDNTTPQFSWTKPAGVPYSHIVLSDERIQLGEDGTISIETIRGVSMIWQAITANTRITYGEPDPSGIFSTAPPPLSPGKEYTWLVFNNYGNNPAYTPSNDLVLPAIFGIAPRGAPKPEPRNIFPVVVGSDTLEIKHTDSSGIINFRWTNIDPTSGRAIPLDPNVSVYRVFVYTQADMGDINAQVVVWSGEITAGQFAGKDTAMLSMNARNILSRNLYSWRVIAIYKDGSGQAGALSHFNYSAPTGTIRVHTREEIEAGGQVFTPDLALVELEIEVIQGTLEETMLFFTDMDGWATRDRAVGTSRITARKSGYESASQIVSIRDGDTTNVELMLRRPIPSIFGRIVDTLGNPVDLANIIAVSDNGDTVRTQSLPDGNFIMNCKPEAWTLFVSRQGFLTTPGRRVILGRGTIAPQDTIIIRRNPLVFSGTIRNSEGQPVTGATIRVLSADGNTEVAALLSTPSTGRFSFPLLQGTYIISATKAGLVSKDTTIQFSASQDRVITLESGAAMLQGTLYGTSWIEIDGTLREMSAAITSARVDVIRKMQGGRDSVIATSLTDRVYGTYSISVPANSEKYLLRFSADGFNSREVLTNSEVRAGHTYSQNDTIRAFATISGRVLDENGKAVSGVSVSLININSGQAAATSRSTPDGSFTFFRVPDGDYSISANGNGRALDFVQQRESGTGVEITDPLITAKGGKFTNTGESKDIALVNVITKEARGIINFKARTNSADNWESDTSISIVVFSPFVQKIDENKLENIDPSIPYFVRAVSSNSRLNLIDLAEKRIEFAHGTEVLEQTILMPFRYMPSSTIDTEKTTLEVSTWVSGITIDSARVHYRHRGETEFIIAQTLKQPSTATGKIAFEITPKNAGSVIEYYFEIFTDSGIYSNHTNPYNKLVRANPRLITHWELLPTTQNVALALNGRMEFFVKAYYGANFEEMTINANDFTWTLTGNASTDRNQHGTSKIITGNKAGEATLVVSTSIQRAPGVPAEIKVPIRITDSEIGSIKIVMLSEPERPEFLTNTENAIFGIEARDKKGELVSERPRRWIVNPSSAGSINVESGIFTPKSDFIGRVNIVAEVNSRVRDEFVFNGEKGLLIAYTANSAGGKVSDGTAELSVAKEATANPIIVSLDRPVIRNFVERNVEGEGVFIISDIYEVRRRLGEDFTGDVELKLFVPKIYHSNLRGGQNDANKLGIAIWDRDSLQWLYLEDDGRAFPHDFSQTDLKLKRPVYDHNDKSLTISVGEYINELNNVRVAIIARGLKTDAEVSISPNPFSPFVSPMNDYLHITGMRGDVKGTCIKITPKSNNTKFKPSAQIAIFTADGTPVYRATLNGLDAGQSYYLFWDGRKQLSQTAFNSVDILPNTAIFVRGDEMLRNGRYFVNITIDDGKEKKRYTREIILFK